MFGQQGHDVLKSMCGRDFLHGGVGGDHLDGGTGGLQDMLFGDVGADTYVWEWCSLWGFRVQELENRREFGVGDYSWRRV